MCDDRIMRFVFICSRVELDQMENDKTYSCRDTFTLPIPDLSPALLFGDFSVPPVLNDIYNTIQTRHLLKCPLCPFT